MPPLSQKSKQPKGRDGRQSRSRNTTPSSNISVPISTTMTSTTAYLDIEIGKLMVPTNVTYDEIINKHGGGGGIPDPGNLETMVENLKMLGQLAETRGASCDGGMRELSKRRKERQDEELRLEQENRERVDKENLKRAAEDEEEARGRKSLQTKKQKKERSSAREERPLAIGAHGVARQDGLDLPSHGKFTECVLPSCSF